MNESSSTTMASSTSARTVLASSISPLPPLGRRIRKKKAVLNLKETYQAEIFRWDILSNTLGDLNLKTQNVEEIDGGGELLGFSRCGIVHQLLAQLEAQEAMINNVSNLCKAAEALCNVQEVRSKHLILDLPVWDSSPRELSV